MLSTAEAALQVPCVLQRRLLFRSGEADCTGVLGVTLCFVRDAVDQAPEAER